MVSILLIEDDAELRSTLAGSLTRRGYEVVTFSNGKQALEKFSARFDLVITDILMPEKEGLQTIVEIREQADVPIIAISGGGRTRNEEFLQAAKMLGATSVLQKPFRATEFLSAVEDTLKSHSRHNK